ncbi:MAG: hypothetical protein AAF384_15485 [Pseudomonadota bacterium]
MLSPDVLAQTLIAPGHYEVESRTFMPHLDEMRRTVSTRRVCLSDSPDPLFSAFEHPALIGCKLGRISEDLEFEIACAQHDGAKGKASFELSANGLQGTLNLKMGGKNMTFSQTIRATRQGDCLGKRQGRTPAKF